MYKTFRDTDYSVLKNNYKTAKEEKDRLFWELLMNLKSKNYNESNMSDKNTNKTSNKLRYLFLNTKYMHMQDSFYGAKTPDEKEFWKHMIEQKHKEIEIIMNSEKKHSDTVANENIYAHIKGMSYKEKELLCNNTLYKLFNNPKVKKIFNDITEKNSKINKEQATKIATSKVAISLLTKDLMKEPKFDKILVDIIKKERANRVYTTTKEDLEKYPNVNKAIKEGRFKFLQTNEVEGTRNRDIKNNNESNVAELKNNIMKSFSKVFDIFKK